MPFTLYVAIVSSIIEVVKKKIEKRTNIRFLAKEDNVLNDRHSYIKRAINTGIS